mgnify:CR=1 FL=1
MSVTAGFVVFASFFCSFFPLSFFINRESKDATGSLHKGVISSCAFGQQFPL